MKGKRITFITTIFLTLLCITSCVNKNISYSEQQHSQQTNIGSSKVTDNSNIQNTTNNDPDDSSEYHNEFITPLNSQKLSQVKDIPSVYIENNTEIKNDFTEKNLLYSVTFSDIATFEQVPIGFTTQETIDWGKDPGLGINILKQHGFDGTGSIIAYIDQNIVDHEQFKGINLHYQNNTGVMEGNMHGMAVLSLLAGKDIGIIPKAEIYYYAQAAWERDQKTHSECLYQIIEQNEKLPDDKKIKMVGISDIVDESEKNVEEFEKAIKACEDSGVMVFLCDEYSCAYFIPERDRNNPDNVDAYDENIYSDNDMVFVPTTTRTTATTMNGAKYIYWGQEGQKSWLMPYVLGVYADALSIDPTLTEDDLKSLLSDTAIVNVNGVKVINPIGFIAAVLEKNNRQSEADDIREEYKNSLKYFYAIIDKNKMTDDDIVAIEQYLDSIKDVTVLEVDPSSCSSACEIYSMIKEDTQHRGGVITGIQIFGSPEDIPSFVIQYKAKKRTSSGYEIFQGIADDDININTDIFYSNFNNEPNEINENYSVYNHFTDNKDIDLIPEWPVVRLPLKSGQYKAFFDKYNEFVQATDYKQLPLINFNSPNYDEVDHVDDVNLFLDRLCDEFGFLNKTDYRLYGNTDGECPVNNSGLLGNFTADNISNENKKGIYEFLLYGFGRYDHISNNWYENGNQNLTKILTPNTINDVFAFNPYYLDCWACYSGRFMEGRDDNFTARALNGNCVGMFAMTTFAPKTGLDCRASVEEMKNGNYFYFYYTYFKSLSEGKTRAAAFYDAQKAFAESLIEDSKGDGVDGAVNFQMALYTLFACENFGVVEPNTIRYYNLEKNAEFRLVSEPGMRYCDYTYTGKEIRPEVEIKNADTDNYEIIYKNNIEPCAHSVFDNGFDPEYTPCVIITDKTNGSETKIYFRILKITE